MKIVSRRSAFAAAACLLSALPLSAAYAQTSPEEEEEANGSPVITKGQPGELVVDASDDNGVIEVKDEGLTFSSREELIDYAVHNFNGEVVRDESGNAIGVFGKLTVYGKLRYGDEHTQLSEQVDDYMVSVLGGKSGVVVINGEAFCLKENGCSGGAFAPQAPSYAPPPEESSRCNDLDNLCVALSSWKQELPAKQLPIYRTIGSDIEQTKGGFQTSHHFCWKFGFIPWSCSESRGANRLTLRNLYRFETPPVREGAPGVATGAFEHAGQRDNIEEIDLRMWSLFTGVTVKEGEVRPQGPASTTEAQLTGVCGSGSSSDRTGNSVETRTASGNVTEVCE